MKYDYIGSCHYFDMCLHLMPALVAAVLAEDRAGVEDVLTSIKADIAEFIEDQRDYASEMAEQDTQRRLPL